MSGGRKIIAFAAAGAVFVTIIAAAILAASLVTANLGVH